MAQRVGDNGEQWVPFDIYFTNVQGREFVGRFLFYVLAKSKELTLNVQMVGMDEKKWR